MERYREEVGQGGMQQKENRLEDQLVVHETPIIYTCTLLVCVCVSSYNIIALYYDAWLE